MNRRSAAVPTTCAPAVPRAAATLLLLLAAAPHGACSDGLADDPLGRARGDGGRRDGAVAPIRAGLDAGTARDGDGGCPMDDPDCLSGRPDAGEEACGGDGPGVRGTPPNVLIVLDRSCSMRRRVTGGDGLATDTDTKWYLARQAVDRVTARFATQIRWGILLFPSVLQGCATPGTGGVSAPAQVEPQAGGAALVTAAMRLPRVSPFDVCGSAGLQPNNTPLVRALDVARTSTALRDATRNNYVLLVTDGIETCYRDTAETMLATRAADMCRAARIRTAVVGFNGNANVAQLEALARNGCAARPGGPPSYYVAEDGAALESALSAFAASATGCTFTLASRPPDPARLHVVGTGPRVMDVLPRDPARMNGWEYDAMANTITLYGATCARVRAGEITNLNVTYGCPVTRCIPQPEYCDGLDNDCDGMVDDACMQPPG